MEIALYIIAICEVIRMAQNAIQLSFIKRDNSARDNAYAEFVKSLKQSDREFVWKTLKQFEESEDNK